MRTSRAPRAPRFPVAIGLIAVVAFAVSMQAPAAPAGPLAPGDVPEKAVTLGKGRLWKEPWRLVAFRRKRGDVCEGIVRKGDRSQVCSSVPQVADPILIPYSHTKSGPKPTSYLLIAVSAEIATLKVRLAPGGRTLTEPIRELSADQSRRSGLPPGFRFVVAAVPKKRGVARISGFAPGGRLVDRRDGPGAPS